MPAPVEKSLYTDLSQQYQRKELKLALNPFERPAELSGSKAWIQQIINLLYMKKGTYPTDPDLGVDIQSYDFQFTDTAVLDLQHAIDRQVSDYLPMIPISNINVTTTEINGNIALLIYVSIIERDGLNVAVVAADVSKNIINFAVTM
jgi:hypothetical protein